MSNFKLPCFVVRTVLLCNAQSLAVTNRVTEQLVGWQLRVFVRLVPQAGCASHIDDLNLLDLMVLVIYWQHVSIIRGTIRGDPQETLYHVRSRILLFYLVIFMCNHNEAEKYKEITVPALERSSSVGVNQRWVALADTHIHTHVCVQRAEPLLDGFSTN